MQYYSYINLGRINVAKEDLNNIGLYPFLGLTNMSARAISTLGLTILFDAS